MKPTLQDGINMLSDDELREALKKREKHIKEEGQPVIKLNKEMSYRCVEYDNQSDYYKGLTDAKGYFLQFKWWQDDEWVDVTDLTELKVWEYNKLVDKLNKVFPEYPIEYLEGRFV